MQTSVCARRWCGGIGSGKSAALRVAVAEAIAKGVRPLAYLPTVTDVGLRTERVDLTDAQVADALGAAELNGRLTRNLSSGERQRVRLVSALSRAARFAALDEPCRHLDPEHVEALNAVLQTRNKDGLHLAVCDGRGLLASGVFQEEHGSAATDEPLPEPCPPPQGDPLAIDLPTPFLLSATGRPTAKQRLEVDRGAIVVVLGPNGSGKTSLLEALAQTAAKARIRVGVSRQEPEHQVFASSIARELEDVAAAHKGAPWCRQARGQGNGFQQLIVNLELERWLDCPTPRLPLGVLSLLGVAIALWMGHDLALLDEPTQGLDAGTARRLTRELVRCAREGARIVVASHDPELVRVANRRWTTNSGVLTTENAS